MDGDNSRRVVTVQGMTTVQGWLVIVLEMQIIKGKETVIGRMTFLGMVVVADIGMGLVLRRVNVLVMVRAAIWTLWFKELYLI